MTRLKQMGVIGAAVVLFMAILCVTYQLEKRDAVKVKEQQTVSEEDVFGKVTATLGGMEAPDGAKKNVAAVVQWWFNKADEKYYLIVPSTADLTNLQWGYEGQQVMRIDGIPIEKNTSHAIAVGEHIVDTGEGSMTYSMVVLQSANLGAMFLTTDSGNLGYIDIDKEHEEPGSAVIIDATGNCIYQGKLSAIAGRGNTTWDSSDKRGYQIKFPKKEDLFGMGAAKKWVLLANYFDESMLRNDFAYNLATQAEVPFTPETVFVDLYMNGRYWGNYQISEKIEVDEERVAIPDLQKATEEVNPEDDLESFDRFGMESLEQSNSIPDTSIGFKIPNNPSDITGGYLLEYDLGGRYIHELSGFATVLNQAVVIKSPKCASKEQVDYISNLYQQFEDAVTVYEGINPETGVPYYDYIDMDSYAKAYLIEEITKNVDASISSRYFFKYPDSYSTRFFAGPVWDYDFAMGNYGEGSGKHYSGEQPAAEEEAETGEETSYSLLDPRGLYAMKETEGFNIWYALYYRPEFQTAFRKAYWDIFRENALLGATDRIPQQATQLATSAVLDRIRWFGATYDSMSETEQLYQQDVKRLQDFVTERVAFLDKEWADTAE